MKIIALVFVLCAGLQGSRGGCPNNFEKHGDGCYKVMVEPVSWINAKLYCQVFGADLVKIETQEEETLLETVLNEIHINRTARIENYWVDGSDLLAEGEWMWVGTPGYSQYITSFTHWAPGQPDNNNNGEDCMLIKFNLKLFWSDERCTTSGSFICEAEYSEDPDSIIG
ncbi:Perlucin [Mizuhopecten yessoensis]|uniref:Perlucin n=1 Tax=Mizuhopecten yessoensis TaxID=6573 RepID=A0A210Q794_MIZYE|nr:Perlucin [Mizuhopecten yessoensis]